MRAFRLAYDGRPFHGFQRQPDVPTVEDAILDALGALGVESDGEIPPGYAAAGRTDRGVSAVAQTVAFDCPAWLTPRALNGELPDAIRAWASAEVPDTFHATHDATAREYVYHLFAPDADRERAQMAAEALSGRHDWHNLTTDETGTVRDLSVGVTRDGDYLVVTFRGGGFARHLVRRAVSLVSAVGAGEADRGRIDRVLGEERLGGPAGVEAAPAYPLVLTEVAYDVAFEREVRAATEAARRFAERRAEHATRARVARAIERGID
jgi:tRNA pseudouridine38-40 synthase